MADAEEPDNQKTCVYPKLAKTGELMEWHILSESFLPVRLF